MTYQSIVELLDDPNPVEPPPGKFEGCHDLRVAEALYAMTLDGSVDDQMGSVDEGMWSALIGRFVVIEESQGFFGYEVFPTDEEAKASFLGH